MIEENKIDTEITENPATIKKQLNLKRGRVFIRNLPFTITEEKLRTLFQQHGEVTEVMYILLRLIFQKKKEKINSKVMVSSSFLLEEML